MKLFIVHYSHRHGNDYWPMLPPKGVSDDWEPTLEWMLANNEEFAGQWEGEGSKEDRDDESYEYRKFDLTIN